MGGLAIGKVGGWVSGLGGRGRGGKKAWGCGGGDGMEERRIWEEEIEWALKKIHPLTGDIDQGYYSICQKKYKRLA